MYSKIPTNDWQGLVEKDGFVCLIPERNVTCSQFMFAPENVLEIYCSQRNKTEATLTNAFAGDVVCTLIGSERELTCHFTDYS